MTKFILKTSVSCSVTFLWQNKKKKRKNRFIIAKDKCQINTIHFRLINQCLISQLEISNSDAVGRSG